MTAGAPVPLVSRRARPPRVCLFADSYHEVNGLALTSRQLHQFATRRGYPFLAVVAGSETRWESGATTSLMTLALSPVSVPVDVGLWFDPLFLRHYGEIRQALGAFRPDLIHITSLGHCSIVGAIVAKRMGIPTIASWHTNLHEFGALRLRQATAFLPAGIGGWLAEGLNRLTLAGVCKFYSTARMLLAPNSELVRWLEVRTGKQTRLMPRGVDADLFSPKRRQRSDSAFVLGFVGRLSAEKNVRFLADLESALEAAGKEDFRFLIVGQGSERNWLERHMRRARFPGVLVGEALARAYADMDLFVFPSRSDTFGNVIQEAHASGVPTVVTAGGGPKFLVEDGVSGFIGHDDAHFVQCVVRAMDSRTDLDAMRRAARRTGERASWSRVFEDVYSSYTECCNRHPRHGVADQSAATDQGRHG